MLVAVKELFVCQGCGVDDEAYNHSARFNARLCVECYISEKETRKRMREVSS